MYWVLSLGADGTQVGTRFIATKECDVDNDYKQVFVNADLEDLLIIESPVGMPAWVVRNAFVERMVHSKEKITHCYDCLKACNFGKATIVSFRHLLTLLREMWIRLDFQQH